MQRPLLRGKTDPGSATRKCLVLQYVNEREEKFQTLLESLVRMCGEQRAGVVEECSIDAERVQSFRSDSPAFYCDTILCWVGPQPRMKKPRSKRGSSCVIHMQHGVAFQRGGYSVCSLTPASCGVFKSLHALLEIFDLLPDRGQVSKFIRMRSSRAFTRWKPHPPSAPRLYALLQLVGHPLSSRSGQRAAACHQSRVSP